MTDIAEFNSEIDDGYDKVKILVKTNGSSQSKNQFERIKGFLIKCYPVMDRSIQLINVPANYYLSILLRVVECVSISIMLFTLLFKYIHFSIPFSSSVYSFLNEYRFSVLFMCYFIYFLLSDIVYNRSFEVYIDDELVFSKIKKYRYPSETEIKDILDQHLKGASKKTI